MIKFSGSDPRKKYAHDLIQSLFLSDSFREKQLETGSVDPPSAPPPTPGPSPDPVPTPESPSPTPFTVTGLLKGGLMENGLILTPLQATGEGAQWVSPENRYAGHGNSNDNPNLHIVYKFSFVPRDGKTPVIKYGI